MATQNPDIPAELQQLVHQFITFCYDEARSLDRVNLKQTRLSLKKGEMLLHLPYLDRNRQKLKLRVIRKQDIWGFSDDGRTLSGTKRSTYETYLRHVVQWYDLSARKGVLMLETPASGFSGRLYTFIRVLRTLDHLAGPDTLEAA